MTGRLARGLRFGALMGTIAFTASACTEVSNRCVPGAERCSCAPNNACLTGLTCLSNVCVAAQAPSSEPAKPDAGSSQPSPVGVDALPETGPSARTDVSAIVPDVGSPPARETAAPAPIDAAITPPGMMRPDTSPPPPTSGPVVGVGPSTLLPPNAPLSWRHARGGNLVTIAPDGFSAIGNGLDNITLEGPVNAPLSFIDVRQRELPLAGSSCATLVRQRIQEEPTAQIRDGIQPRADSSVEAWAMANVDAVYAAFSCHLDLLPNQRALVTETVTIGHSYAELDSLKAIFLLRTLASATGPALATATSSLHGSWYSAVPSGVENKLVLLEFKPDGTFLLGYGYSDETAPTPAAEVIGSNGYYAHSQGTVLLTHVNCTFRAGDPTQPRPAVERPCEYGEAPLALRVVPAGPNALEISGLPLSIASPGTPTRRERITLPRM